LGGSQVYRVGGNGAVAGGDGIGGKIAANDDEIVAVFSFFVITYGNAVWRRGFFALHQGGDRAFLLKKRVFVPPLIKQASSRLRLLILVPLEAKQASPESAREVCRREFPASDFLHRMCGR